MSWCTSVDGLQVLPVIGNSHLGSILRLQRFSCLRSMTVRLCSLGSMTVLLCILGSMTVRLCILGSLTVRLCILGSLTVRFSSVSRHQSVSASSSRGVIPKAKIKTIKMTFVIVLGKHISYITSK